MNAVDTNILVYAAMEKSPWHNAAIALVRGLAQGATEWAIPWPCVHEFLSVVTNPRIYRPSATPAEAMGHVESWLDSPSLRLLAETSSFVPVLRDVLVRANAVGGAVHDARIAALCIHHGVSVLYSADRDFSRFPQLRTQNPLV